MNNKEMRAHARLRRSALVVLCFVLPVAGILSLLLGCSHPPVSAMLDEAFALVYPDLSARLVKEFPAPTNASKTAAKAASPYLSYPVQPGKIESLIHSITQGGHPGSASLSMHLFIASPAVADAFPFSLLNEDQVCMSLLSRPRDLKPTENAISIVPQQEISILWDSEWAYRQIGLIAGYHIGIERKNGNTEAKAAILFSGGVGRSEADLDAFAQSFQAGMQTAGAYDSDSDRALLSFNVDRMNLPGDRLEQALSALAQVKDKQPSLLLVAAGSRTVLEKAQEMRGAELAADLRGLGQGIPTRNLFAAIGENNGAIVAAIRNAARLIENKNRLPPVMSVKPSLQFSREAARIDAILKRTAGR